MSEAVKYVTHVETRVVVIAELLSGDELPVGEFVVHTETRGNSGMTHPMRHMLDLALAKLGKNVHTMGAAVQNTENNRLK